MNKSSLLTSAAAGVLVGAFVFGASPARSQMAVIDWASIAIQNALQSIQNQMSNTLNTITRQLGLTGPLGSILGDATNGSVTALLQQGFTQNANYSRAQVSAGQQIVDGALTSNARFSRDMRNAQIRDEHTANPLHCASLDNGQTIVAGAGEAFKVAAAIQNVTDPRGEGGPHQPAHEGYAQAIGAINQLHLSRYCDQNEADAGLCSLSQTPNADLRAISLFGPGTLPGQAGVNAANDYATNLVQGIVPAALRGEQLTSSIGMEAAARRREYNARMSLARGVLSYAISTQAPSVTLSDAQKTQMQNEGMTPVDTGSWYQALMLDAERRYSDVNWAAQLQTMPPAAVERELAHELAATNYLLAHLFKIDLFNATTNAALLAATEEHHFQPPGRMPTPSMSN
ncbi:hypothetical protein [Methylocapsa palsarum]|uniref:TraW protein n=1 Tax=Methylocapsa palsarum TaxID=1612308 RepID=A0A1I4CFY4_9HYPH|nr:hypothetical protein [Methylocapsa palsarum]SFK80104.1 hypothetical protein SAMN05444581_12212 [Methylocapsa palsarum]